MLIGIALALRLVYVTDFLGFKSNLGNETVDSVQALFKKPTLCLNEAERNIALKEENVLLSKEVARLRQELEERVDLTKTYLEADIVLFKNEAIVLNVGTKASVKKNNLVVVGQSLVGKIVSTQATRSEAITLQNRNFSLPCRIESDQNIWGEVNGRGNAIFFSKILQEKQTKINDTVICEGFVAGKIKSLKKNVSETFYEAEIEPAVDLDNLDKVDIVIE